MKQWDLIDVSLIFCDQIGELRSGSPRLTELNDFVRKLYKKKFIDVLSFCEVIIELLYQFFLESILCQESANCWLWQTKVTPIVEGYGGWAFRMEIVPMESAYPGFGELVVSFQHGSLEWPFYPNRLECSLTITLIPAFFIQWWISLLALYIYIFNYGIYIWQYVREQFYD